MRLLFLDTCTWLKLEILEREELFKNSKLFNFGSLAITYEIKEELEYFSISSLDLRTLIVYPIKNKILYKQALELGFDEADASLLSNGKIEEEELYLISEDRGVISFGQFHKMNIMQLADFFMVLTASNHLTKRNCYHLIKFLRKQRNITHKKEQNILGWLKLFK